MIKILFMKCLILMYFKLLVGYKDIYSFLQNTDNAENAKLISCLSNLINLCLNYDVSFHFDTNNKDLIEQVMAQINFNIISTITIYNYNYDSRLFRKTYDTKLVHLVVLNNPEEFTLKIQSSDVIYYVVENYEIISDLKKNTSMNLLGNVLFIVFDKENDSVRMYTVCYYCGKLSGRIVEFEFHKKHVDNTKLLARNFTNLNGDIFKIIFINYFPVVWCEKTGKEVLVNNKIYKECIKLKGSEYHLIQLVSQKLNFKTLFILYENEYLQAINETGIGMFNVAMGGITFTKGRSEIATFTAIYWYEGYSLLFFYSKSFWKELLGFSQPLQKSLWIGVVVACLLNTLILGLIGRKEKHRDPKISLTNTFWVCMKTLIDQQASYKTIKKIQRRSLLLLAAWYMVCVNINTAYKSKVLSSLLNPSHKEPQTFVELLENNFAMVTNSHYNDVAVGLFSYGQVLTKYKTILRNPILKDSVCEEFDYAANNQAAIIDERTSLQYEIRTNCYEEIKKNQLKLHNVRITRPIKMFGYGWALPKGAPYKQAFNRVISRIIPTGLLQKWREDATRHLDCNHSVFYTYENAGRNRDYGNVSLGTLVSPFFIYILGHVCASVAFAVELAYYKTRNSSKSREI